MNTPQLFCASLCAACFVWFVFSGIPVLVDNLLAYLKRRK